MKQLKQKICMLGWILFTFVCCCSFIFYLFGFYLFGAFVRMRKNFPRTCVNGNFLSARFASYLNIKRVYEAAMFRFKFFVTNFFALALNAIKGNFLGIIHSNLGEF